MFLVDGCEFYIASLKDFTFEKPSEKLFFENLSGDCLVTEKEKKSRQIDLKKLRKCRAALIKESS